MRIWTGPDRRAGALRVRFDGRGAGRGSQRQRVAEAAAGTVGDRKSRCTGQRHLSRAARRHALQHCVPARPRLPRARRVESNRPAVHDLSRSGVASFAGALGIHAFDGSRAAAGSARIEPAVVAVRAGARSVRARRQRAAGVRFRHIAITRCCSRSCAAGQADSAAGTGCRAGVFRRRRLALARGRSGRGHVHVR